MLSIRRRDFIAAIGGATCPVSAWAQPRNPTRRIAFISGGDNGGPIESVFRRELARLGWVEGRDLRIEALHASDNRTGVVLDTEIAAERLDLLHKPVPTTQSIAMLAGPGFKRKLQSAARTTRPALAAFQRNDR